MASLVPVMDDRFCMWPYCSVSMSMTDFASNKQILYKFMSLTKSGLQICGLYG